MGAKNKRQKPIKILDAEITADGCVIVELNVALKMGNSKKLMLPPETVFALGEECASMPPAADTDYPGVPVVEETDIWEDEPDGAEEEEDGEGEEDGG